MCHVGVGWVIKGWDGVGHVGWGGSCRGGVAYVGVAWVMQGWGGVAYVGVGWVGWVTTKKNMITKCTFIMTIKNYKFFTM